MNSENTNVHDVFITFIFFGYVLAMFGGSAYLIDRCGWSPWWLALTVLIVSGSRVKTGSHK